MVNVYQIKFKREIYITDYLEVNENLDLQDRSQRSIAGNLTVLK